MNVPTPGPGSADSAEQPRNDALRTPPRKYSRAELERIFGSEPLSTRDDLPEPELPREDWYRENRPPHHG